MVPIDVPCIRCGAAAGERCRNYLGQNKPTCTDRGQPGQQWQHAQAETSERPARSPLAEELPLFADLIDKPYQQEAADLGTQEQKD